MQKPAVPSVCKFPEFKDWLETGALEGEGYAHWKLALSYLDGSLGEKSLNKAAVHLREAKKLQIAFAPYCLAQLLLTGQIEAEPGETVAGLYEDGAILGHARSMREAAKIFMLKAVQNPSELVWARNLLMHLEWNGCHTSGIELRFIDAFRCGVNPNRGEAQLLARRAGIEGHAAALHCYGSMVLHGYAAAANEATGLSIWEDALKLGSREVSLDMYEYAIDHPSYTVPIEARKPFEDLVMKGHPEALYIMARRCLASPEPFALKRAKEYLEKAIRYNHGPSLLRLATLEWDGNVKDRERCSRAMAMAQGALNLGMGQRAIEQLGDWAFSIIESTGVSHPSLLQLIAKAAELNFHQAMNIALYYSGTKDTPIDLKKEFFWLTAAALDGHSDATRVLAMELYSPADKKDQNQGLALQLLEYSASLDNSYSCAILGDHFREGSETIIINPSQSAHWYHQGALLGYKYCQAKLSWCYANAFGVAQDLDKANYWDDISESRLIFDSIEEHPPLESQSSDSDADDIPIPAIPFRFKKSV